MRSGQRFSWSAFRALACAGVIAFGVTGLGTGAAQALTVDGDADIFAAGVTSIPASDTSGNHLGNGTAPPSITVFGGEKLLVTATGLVSCCDTTNMAPTGPDGYATNPFGGVGSTINDSIVGSTIGTYTSVVGAFALVGVFTGNGVSTPFTIGSSDTFVVPTGDTKLYFGFADGAGFNNASGYYQDNNGSLSVSVSAIPEPSTWAMLLLGFLGVGFLARRKKSNPPFRFA